MGTRSTRCQAWRMKIQLVQSTTSSGFETKWKLGSSKGYLAEVGLYGIPSPWSNQVQWKDTYMGGSLTFPENRTIIATHKISILEYCKRLYTMNMNEICMIILILCLIVLSCVWLPHYDITTIMQLKNHFGEHSQTSEGQVVCALHLAMSVRWGPHLIWHDGQTKRIRQHVHT